MDILVKLEVLGRQWTTNSVNVMLVCAIAKVLYHVHHRMPNTHVI